MKRIDLIRTIAGFGCILVRHGGRHDWYRNPETGVARPIPRHAEIKDRLARHIINPCSLTRRTIPLKLPRTAPEAM
jgi:mRNA interferase HicA